MTGEEFEAKFHELQKQSETKFFNSEFYLEQAKAVEKENPNASTTDKQIITASQISMLYTVNLVHDVLKDILVNDA